MTVSIKGVEYETVHSRLTAAHDSNARPKGIKSIETTPMEVAERLVVCATITFNDDRVFSGMSEAKLDATSGADRDAPVECAETSAVGRALANAGYSGSEGLASRDEIRSAQNRGARWNRPGAAPAAPVPNGSAAPRRISPQDGPKLAQGLDVPPTPQSAQDDPFAGMEESAAGPTGGPPATDKQLAALARFGIKPDGPISRQDASTLLSDAIAARDAQRGGGR